MKPPKPLQAVAGSTGTTAPDPPAWLAGEALAFWNRLAPQLAAGGLLLHADTESFASACWWWGQFHRLMRHYEALPVNGAASPVMVQMGIAYDKFCRASERFGLTPQDRAKLGVQPPQKPGGGVATRKRG